MATDSLLSDELPVLAPDQLLLRDSIRRFVSKEIVPIEGELRRNGATEIPESVLGPIQEKARRSGLWCFETPEKFGGAGMGPMELALAYEEGAKHTYSSPDVGGGAFGFDPPNILQAGTPEQQEKYIPPAVNEGSQWFMAVTEPSGGSDPARSIQTRARRVNGDWVIDGAKMFTSRADVATHGIIFARTGEGRAGITAFIVTMPVKGMSIRKVEVIRDHHTTEVTLEGVRVSDADVLGEVGGGFNLSQRWFNIGRIKIAAQAIGMATAALEIAIDYAKQRSTFGQLLAARQLVQKKIVDSYIAIQAGRWLVYEAALRAERGEDPKNVASAAKVFCTEEGYKVVDRAMQILGGIGLAREMPLEHWLRAIRVLRVVEGPTEVHEMVLARALLGQAATGRTTTSVREGDVR